MRYNYQEVITIIQNTRRFGQWTGYEVSKHMLERLGNPQTEIPFVHIAGTNGKGSTTAFLCSILQQTGKKIGMFTSPHLVTFRERICINGEYISEDDVTRLGNLLLETTFDLPPTMFDYCLAMAVLYFKEQNCDLMVMETGIGGRYDSTNALGTPEVAVITKIGLDHTAILGDTLEQIAGEKAGIIKKGCPVVTAIQEKEVREVLLENFLNVNGLLKDTMPSTEDFILGGDCDFQQDQKCVIHTQSQEEENGIAIYEVSQEDLNIIDNIPMKMQGSYQRENASMAMLAAKILFTKWVHNENKAFIFHEDISETFETWKSIQEVIKTYIYQGIASAMWKGRMELLNDNPFFLIDGAHNAHGVHALAESLKKLYPNEKFHFIMAVMADKDYEEMIEELLPLAIDFITVTPESNRALQSKDLAECIQKKGIKAIYAEDMESVIRPFLPKKTNEDVICAKKTDEKRTKTIAFGSLYFIGEIEAMMEN